MKMSWYLTCNIMVSSHKRDSSSWVRGCAAAGLQGAPQSCFSVSCLQLALPYLRQNQGNIINISSLVGTIGQRHAVPYVATKVNQRPSRGGTKKKKSHVFQPVCSQI